MIQKRLKEIRINKGISQIHVAKKLGYSQQRYNQLENGIRKLDANLLPDIAEALGIDPEDLFKELKR